jgi:hypothetical protein
MVYITPPRLFVYEMGECLPERVEFSVFGVVGNILGVNQFRAKVVAGIEPGTMTSFSAGL